MLQVTMKKLDFHFLSHWMGYDRGNSFPFDFEPNGIPFGSKYRKRIRRTTSRETCVSRHHKDTIQEHIVSEQFGTEWFMRGIQLRTPPWRDYTSLFDARWQNVQTVLLLLSRLNDKYYYGLWLYTWCDNIASFFQKVIKQVL